MFSIVAAAELSGIAPQTLRNWIAAGMIEPAIRKHKSGSRGLAHQFSVPQMVGILIAKELQDSERGCSLKYVGDTLKVFSNITEAWLKHEFSEGNTHFVRPHISIPILRGEGAIYGWPNVKDAYSHVLASGGE